MQWREHEPPSELLGCATQSSLRRRLLRTATPGPGASTCRLEQFRKCQATVQKPILSAALQVGCAGNYCIKFYVPDDCTANLAEVVQRVLLLAGSWKGVWP